MRCAICGKESRSGPKTQDSADGFFCSDSHRNDYTDMIRDGGSTRRWIQLGEKRSKEEIEEQERKTND